MTRYSTCRATVASLLLVLAISAVGWADVACVADAAGCCCRGTRGNVDCDADDRVDVVDLLRLIDYLYLSLEPLPSLDEANVDGDDGIDISDLTALVNFLYCAGSPPASCAVSTNHPPQTTLWANSKQPPYIDIADSGFGVPCYWYGSDRYDHPYLRPPLTYDWRAYGPYDSAQLRDIKARFERQVFVTPTGKVYPLGYNETIRWCDTTWIIGPPNQIVISCHTMRIDTVTVPNRFGWLEHDLDLRNPLFQNDTALNRIALSSDNGLTDTSVELHGLFRNTPHDTTTWGVFIFWIRACDADDTTLYDPIPSYRSFDIYEPKFERDVLLADAGLTFNVNGRKKGAADQYWKRALQNWRLDVSIDTTTISQTQGNELPLHDLLKHRIVIVLNDDAFAGVVGVTPVLSNLHSAMDAGVNVWLCGRNALVGQGGSRPNPRFKFSATLANMFGLDSTQYSGWEFYAYDSAMRIDDFVGANAVDSVGWPNLMIDSALLHANYDWSNYPFEPTLSALPEVNHVIPTAAAEVLYTYKSLYSVSHPMLPLSAFQQGKPVVTRIDRTTNRVVVSVFTPYAFDDATSPTSPMQTVVDSVLNWLNSGSGTR